MRPDVAIISPYPQLGTRHGGSSGVASYTANLAHALADTGMSPVVVAPFADGQPERGEDGPVQVRRAFRPGAAAVPHALTEARATGAPVVHLQHELFLYGGPSASAGLLGGLTSAAAGRHPVPAVVTMHQVVDPAVVTGDYTRLHRVAVPAPAARAGFAGLQNTLPRLAAATIVHERPFARFVPGARVIPHGVEPARTTQLDAPDARRAARVALDLPADRLIVLCFGFVAPYKGLEVALDAAALAHPRVHLVIAGGEHPRLKAQGDGYLDQLRNRYGARSRFTGFVTDAEVADWFLAADIALFPYPAPHASSGALALALAYGTPVLVSPRLADACGVDEPARCPLDPVELADRLLHLAGDAPAAGAQRDQMRAATAALAADRSWPAVARAHQHVYEEVLRANGTARRRLRAA